MIGFIDDALGSHKSHQWQLYAAKLDEFDGRTPIEVFEAHIQKIYLDTHQEIYNSYNIWKGKLFEKHTTYTPQSIIYTNPKKIMKYASFLLTTYQTYVSQQTRAYKYLSAYTNMDVAWQKQRCKDDLVYWVINNPDYIEKFSTAQQSLMRYDRVKRNPRTQPSETVIEVYNFPEWKNKVQKTLSVWEGNHNWQSLEYQAATILDIVGSIKQSPKIITEQAKTTSLRPPVTGYVIEELLSKNTHATYLELVANIAKAGKVTHLLTVEEQHLIETINKTLIPDGLANINSAKLIESSSTEVVESHYHEVLTISNDKLSLVFERLEAAILQSSTQYYDVSKKLLST